MEERGKVADLPIYSKNLHLISSNCNNDIIHTIIIGPLRDTAFAPPPMNTTMSTV